MRAPWRAPDGGASWTTAWLNVFCFAVLARYLVGEGVQLQQFCWEPGALDAMLAGCMLSVPGIVYHQRRNGTASGRPKPITQATVKTWSFLRAPWKCPRGRWSWTSVWMNLAMIFTMLRFVAGESLSIETLELKWTPGALTGALVLGIVGPLSALYYGRRASEDERHDGVVERVEPEGPRTVEELEAAT